MLSPRTSTIMAPCSPTRSRSGSSSMLRSLSVRSPIYTCRMRAERETLLGLVAAAGERADELVDRLLEVLTPAQAVLWLQGSDPHLGGARPLDVLEVEGPNPLFDALGAFEQGAFA